MANLQNVAELATDHIAAVVDRARPVARGVALLSTATGGLAYLVGCLVVHGSWRYAWMVVGLLVCGAPAWALWTAFRRLRRAAAAIPGIAAKLQSLTGDRPVRDALYELAEHPQDPNAAPLTGLGKELVKLRSAVGAHKRDLLDLWQTITAVTTLPGLLALGILGSFGLLILSVVFVLAGLAA
ncbi:MAG: hypothetical protein JWM34_2112 [Ilumatobacteraceae bacterium]|nr:hypothetical protein [Ilumatobacteraceae bacterium]